MLKLASILLKKSALISATILLQIIFCLLCVNMIITMQYNFAYVQYKTRNIITDNTLVAQQRLSMGIGSSSSDVIVDDLKGELIGLKYYEDGGTVSCSSNGLYYKLHPMQGDFAKQYKPKMNKGKWLSDIKKSDECIPAVVRKGLFNLDETIILSGTGEQDEKNFKIRVVGILGDNSALIASTSVSVPLTYDSLFITDHGNDIVILEEYNIIEFAESSRADVKSHTICFFEDNVSDSDMLHNYEILNKHFATYTKGQLKDSSLEKLDLYYSFTLPIFIIYTTITLVSLIAFSIVYNKKSDEEIYCMKICGLRPWQDFFIRFSGIAILFIVGAIVSSALVAPLHKILSITLYESISGFNILGMFILFSYFTIVNFVIMRNRYKEKSNEAKRY